MNVAEALVRATPVIATNCNSNPDFFPFCAIPYTSVSFPFLTS
jgi:hypothetical protein